MITFGIITNKGHHSSDQEYRLSSFIDSVEKQNIPEYEILIVGDYQSNRKSVKCIEFDETIKPKWITKKKNIITQNAKYDIIVYLHDYIILDNYWYQGWLDFGWDNWDIAINIIINKDGTRFRYWVVFKYDGFISTHGVWKCSTLKCPDFPISPYIPSYLYDNYKNLYISGSYWIAKKHVMIDEPLDEDFLWGVDRHGEDIEWSYRVLQKYKYVMNPLSAVKLLHQKDKVWSPIDPVYISPEYIDAIYYNYHRNRNE